MSGLVENEQKKKDEALVFRVSATMKCLFMQKIFLPALTNNACDVLERMFQRGTTVFDDTKELRMNVVAVYRPLRSEEDTPSFTHLRETHADMTPAVCNGQLRDNITVCMLGLLYRAFHCVKGRNNGKTCVDTLI